MDTAVPAGFHKFGTVEKFKDNPSGTGLESAKQRLEARKNATSQFDDPLTTFHFFVDANVAGTDLKEAAVFTEVSGLQVELEVEEVAEGGLNTHVHRLPGRAKVSDITLRNGLSTSNALWNWFKEILQGNFTRHHVSIVMVSQKGTEVQRWNFTDALPVKWVGPQLVAGQSNTAIQSLQLAHRGLKIP
jgi:phage tail-like protein